MRDHADLSSAEWKIKMTNIPIGEIVFGPSAVSYDRTNAVLQAENARLHQELHDLRNRAQMLIAENGLLHHHLRTLAYAAQAMLAAVAETQRAHATLADAWQEAGELLTRLQK